LAESGHPEGRVPESVGIDVISMWLKWFANWAN
jgi:hypothetical protein